MPFIISPAENGEYIILKVRVDFVNEGAKRSIIEAQALGKKIGINRYLIDLTESRNHASILATHQFVYRDLVDAKMDNMAHVSFLVDPFDFTYGFLEAAFQSAGYDVHLFRDRDAAVQHLFKDSI